MFKKNIKQYFQLIKIIIIVVQENEKEMTIR